jgi:glutamate dehydrogenase
MSGDVFGNGMLRSKNIRLIGAFNHLHIFLDPNPNAAKSFEERDRLFKLPRSTWKDYDERLISKGGGVFERSAKSIPLSPEVKNALGVEADHMSPDELIRAMLKAPVDLLWNGGIGTYVKSEGESHTDVGDRANDAVRINGKELRCKVVGEGGNLGFTQLGRIEYALRGGRINTDAIDNSAGVDCSDHEVNIKIALAAAIQQGSLSLEDRDKLLAEMTPEVEYLVLRDNILQTQALTIAEMQGVERIEGQGRVIRLLERDGLLDRAIEYLPDDEALEQRRKAGSGLTRPELAVLLAYSKLHLYRDLLNSALPDDDYFSQDLTRYFPVAMRERFQAAIHGHQLRREIIATMTTNSIINRVGSTFFYQLSDDTGMESCDIARAYVVSRDSFRLRDIWAQIEALNGKVAVDVQVEMFSSINRLIDQLTLWLLRNVPQPIDVAHLVKQFAGPAQTMLNQLPEWLGQDHRQARAERTERLTSRGVPENLAHIVALMPLLAGSFDMIQVSDQTGHDLPRVAGTYFALSHALRLGWLHRQVEGIALQGHWDRQALTAMISELYTEQRRLTADVLSHAGKGKTQKAEEIVAAWMANAQKEINRLQHFMDDLTSGGLDISRLVVAIRKLGRL